MYNQRENEWAKVLWGRLPCEAQKEAEKEEKWA